MIIKCYPCMSSIYPRLPYIISSGYLVGGGLMSGAIANLLLSGAFYLTKMIL